MNRDRDRRDDHDDTSDPRLDMGQETSSSYEEVTATSAPSSAAGPLPSSPENPRAGRGGAGGAEPPALVTTTDGDVPPPTQLSPSAGSPEVENGVRLVGDGTGEVDALAERRLRRERSLIESGSWPGGSVAPW